MSTRPGAPRAQAGLTWGEFDRETQAFGLATTGGVVSTTGIAGLTLGGGIGWLMRKYGLTCDNLLSADLVTADGRFLTRQRRARTPISSGGCAGGGGNFGIVTSFEYRLHPVGPVLAGLVVHPFTAAREVARFYREYAQTAPDEVFTEPAFGALPDGQRAVSLFVVHVGPLEQGEKLLRPVREFGTPLEDTIAPISYCAVQQAYDADFPFGLRNYWKSCNLDG